MSLQEGEFVSLLGPSGCGKTTTLRMIAGFIDPSEGTIEMNDRLMSSPAASVPPERRNMSMIFQSYAIWPNMTVFENVAFGLRARRLPNEEVRRRTNEMLAIVKLEQLSGRYPNELSGGQQQRVALARAIVVKPEVLLLDEPLSNLDANLREEMRGEIRRLHDEFNMTTVYVTHDQSEAMAISDRIAVMNKGKVDQLDAPVNIYRKPKTRFVAGFIGRTNFIEGRPNGEVVAFRRLRCRQSPARHDEPSRRRLDLLGAAAEHGSAREQAAGSEPARDRRQDRQPHVPRRDVGLHVRLGVRAAAARRLVAGQRAGKGSAGLAQDRSVADRQGRGHACGG